MENIIKYLKKASLPIATLLLGLGWPEMHTGGSSAPLLIAFGAFFMVLFIITDDDLKIISNLQKVIPKNYSYLIIVIFCLASFILPQWLVSRYVNHQYDLLTLRATTDDLDTRVTIFISDTMAIQNTLETLNFVNETSKIMPSKSTPEQAQTQAQSAWEQEALSSGIIANVTNSVFINTYDESIIELGNKLYNKGIITKNDLNDLEWTLQNLPGSDPFALNEIKTILDSWKSKLD